MKKRIVSLILVVCLATSSMLGCGASKVESVKEEATAEADENAEEAEEVEAVAEEDPQEAEVADEVETEAEDTEAAEQEEVAEDEELGDLSSLGDIEVENGLLDVTITIPETYAGDTSQEDLDVFCKENGFKSVTRNEDGSITYVMSKAKHKEYMKEMSEEMKSTLKELVGSADYPNITDIKTNDDFTKFEIVTKSTELDLSESFSTYVFMMYGALYSYFAGVNMDDVNIQVTFINADSGAVIYSINSADLQ